jgi:hypothetical protein
MLKQQLLRRAGLLFITALVIPMIAACGQAPEVQVISAQGGSAGTTPNGTT